MTRLNFTLPLEDKPALEEVRRLVDEMGDELAAARDNETARAVVLRKLDEIAQYSPEYARQARAQFERGLRGLGMQSH